MTTQINTLTRLLCTQELSGYIKLSQSEFEEKLDLEKKAKAKNPSQPLPFMDKLYKKLFVSQIERLGLKSIFNQLTHAELTTLYQTFAIETEDGKKQPKKNKASLAKHLWREIQVNMTQYFDALVAEEAAIYSQFLETVPAKGKINGEKVAEEVRLMGIEIHLYDLPGTVLRRLLEDTGFDLDDFPINNTKDYVYSLLTGKLPAKKEAKPVKKIVFAKNKPSLSKVGNKFHDLFQHYNADDLRDFCRDQEMKISGTKKELINRILNFVNNGVKDVPKDRKRVDEEEEEEEEEQVEEEEESDTEDVELTPSLDVIEELPSKPSSTKKPSTGIPQTNKVVGKSPAKKTPVKK